MSTRSAIIEKLADGTFRGIYCHFDGYREGVGFTLRDHYTDPEKVKALLDLGDVSCLGRSVESGKDGTGSYMRDRGESGVEARTGATAAEVAEQIGHNGYVYLFADGEWLCNGKKTPPAKAKKPARIVMLDEDGVELESISASDDGFRDAKDALEQAVSS